MPMCSPAVQPLLALIASHVGGNPTQYMFEKAFLHHDLDWRFLTFEVKPENLGDAVRGLRALGFRGGLCSASHKQAVLPCLDRTTDAAAMNGAANFIFREDNLLVGDNTEGKGAVQAIRDVLDPSGKRIVLFAAGPVARAVAVDLAAARVANITVVHRVESEAEELAATLTGKFETPTAAVAWKEDFVVPVDTDILIHAADVSCEMPEIRLPLALDSLRPELLVADVAADASHSWLLSEAAQRGCKTVDGLAMFIEQAVMEFQAWTGVTPDRQILREAVEEFLEL
jgi:shikimate dehydrogenase